MRKFKIPVSWEVCGIVEVEAQDIDEAIEIARDEEGVIPLPTDSDYIDGSWRVSDADPEAIEQLYN